jgi:hypothetical protein
MSSRRARPRRVGAAFAAIALLSWPAGLVQAAPVYTLEERAQAIARPAVVFTELVVEGEVRDKKTGKALTDRPITVTAYCSGVIVDTSGAMVSTRQCVAPTTARAGKVAFETLTDELIAQKKLAAADKQRHIDGLTASAVFTAIGGTGDPQRRLSVQMGDATSGAASPPAISAIPPDSADKDTGLVMVALGRDRLPVVEISTSSTFAAGVAITAIGYQPTAGPTHATTAEQLKITKVKTTSEPTQYLLSPKLKGESRGAALVNTNGLLVGMALFTDSAYDSAAIRALIAQAGVQNRLGDTDRLYRQALDDYFASRYAVAIRKFDKVLAAQPNPVAEEYRARAASRQAIEGGQTPAGAAIPTWLIVLLSALAGAVLSVVILWALLRRHSRVQRLQAENLVPVSLNPFAPTSGSGAYPTSGAGAYPTSGAGSYTPSDPGAPQSQPTVLEIPQAAPPGVPVPLPPHQRPSTLPPAESLQSSTPEPDTSPQSPPTPDFSWPDDDEQAGTSSRPDSSWTPPHTDNR